MWVYQHGPLYWGVIIPFFYLTYCAAGAVMTYVIFGFPRRYWKTGLLLQISMFMPIALDICYNFGWLPKDFDVTPLGTTFAGIGFCIGIVNQRVLNIAPMAHHHLFERIGEGVLVFDARRSLVDFNEEAFRTLGTGLKIGLLCRNLPTPWNGLNALLGKSGNSRTELMRPGETNSWFEVEISSLPGRKGGNDGYFVLLREVTERKRLESKLKSLALHDALTGLFNRHYLEATLAHDIARCRRQKTPLSLIMFDLDRFKLINDRYGHQAGDLVLRTFGQFLATYTRRSDFACRYGGEEFVLVLPDSSLEAAVASANEWREQFAAVPIMLGRVRLKVSFSGGVASFPEHGSGPEDLIQAADAALYLAKRDGRDRIASASLPEDRGRNV